MLSPLLNNSPALPDGLSPDGLSPDAGDTPSAFQEPGRFAQLLSSCLKNSTGCGEPVPTPDLPKKSASGSSFSSLALLSLLQGTAKSSLEAGVQEAGEDEIPDGMLCPRNIGVLSVPHSLLDEASGFPIPSEVFSAITSELGEKNLSSALLSHDDLPSAEEKSDEEDDSAAFASLGERKIISTVGTEESGMSPIGLLSPKGTPLSVKDSAGDENLLSVQEAQVRSETTATVPGSEAMSEQEKLFVTVPSSSTSTGEEKSSVPEKNLSEVGGISSGKKISGDDPPSPPLRKEGIPVPPSRGVAEEKESEAAPFLETGEGKNMIAKNSGNGSENHSTFGEEKEKPSLSEKELPAVKNQGQENNPKPLEFSSADRDGQKEPQSVRSRDGDSPFASLLRAGSPAEAKGAPAASRGAEVPLSTRNGEALGEGMTNVVRFLRRDGLHKASIVVEPPALGRVEIELSSTAGGVEASIRVGSEQLRQLVQDQLIVLRNSLSQQGVQMTSCTVDIGDSRMDQGENKDTGERETLHTAQSASEQGEEPLSFRVDLEQGLLYWMA